MIKRLSVDDVGLVELLEQGATAAPNDTLGRLQARGMVTLMGGAVRLTAKGKARATRIAAQPGLVSDLTLLGAAKAEGRCAFTTDAGASVHVGGGSPVRISG
jgi:hypothetical protein